MEFGVIHISIFSTEVESSIRLFILQHKTAAVCSLFIVHLFMSRPTSSILESSDIIMVDDDDQNDAIIILTEDVAKERVLAVDVIIRSEIGRAHV